MPPTTPVRSRLTARLLAPALALALAAGSAVAQEAAVSEVFRPQPVPADASANTAETPTTVAALLELESKIRGVVDKVLPATVGLIVGQGQGSGVIISPDGYVLTAAHVSGPPGRPVTVIMPDGRHIQGVSMGRNQSLDSGLVRVTDPSALPLPYAPVGTSADLEPGTWTVAVGHPGGYRADRPPVVRVGRVIANEEEYLATDNTLVGGDSGGPLFDLSGRVIGIHSRIGGRIESNIHVPIDRYLDEWDRIVAAEDFGGRMPEFMRRNPMSADDGLRFDVTNTDETDGALITRVRNGSPGDRAGLREGDRVVAVDGEPVQNGQEMMLRRLRLRAGRSTTYTIRRGVETLEVEIHPASRRSGPDGPDFRRPGSSGVMGVMLAPDFSGIGARIEGVLPGGPAEQAGVRPGDVVTAINDRFIRTVDELKSEFSQHEPGDTLELTLQRDGREVRVSVTLVPREELEEEDRLP